MRSLIKSHWYIMAILLASVEWIDTTESSSSSSSSSSSQNNSSSSSSNKTLVPGNKTELISSSRRKRFVRFPASSSYLFDGAGPSARNIGYPIARFSPIQPPVWRQHKSSIWRSPNEFPVRPTMAHRTPRLIFRDDYPTFPSSGIGSSFFQTNQITPDSDEDLRDHRKQQLFGDYPKLDSEKSRNEKKPLWEGDETLCADGQSCEFFLKCWMSAGLLDGSCGGIMFACCQRKDAKASGDLNLLVDTPRDQLHPQLTLDSYTETANDE
ncbi:hypothetical protein PV325_005483, partial [Microctonus aethiopoides]